MRGGQAAGIAIRLGTEFPSLPRAMAAECSDPLQLNFLAVDNAALDTPH